MTTLSPPRCSSDVDDRPQGVRTTADWLGGHRPVRRRPVGEGVLDAIRRLVRAGRPDESALPGISEQVAWGPGPRASQALMLATRARALLDGRLSPSVDDVLALARPVLRHRMALTFAARAAGMTVDGVIDQIGRAPRRERGCKYV